jgi:hypothetical protein
MRDLEMVSKTGLGRGDCPTWCEHEHGNEPVGFHHDGVMTVVPLTNPMLPGGSVKLYINASQNVPTDSPVESACVEVQDEFRTVLLLPPLECLQLARALLEGAREISGEMPDCDRQSDEPELRGLVAQALDGLGPLFTVLDSSWVMDEPHADEPAGDRARSQTV